MMKSNWVDLLSRISGCHRVLAGVAAACLANSCGPGYAAPPVNQELVRVSKTPAFRLERGYVVHQAKCAKCHPFENPADYSPEELTFDIMPTMARKSKLDEADSQAVLEYLLAARRIPQADAASR